MGKNIIIGSKYTLTFSGQWSKGNEYVPLSIVQNLGNSYISKKQVPVNIDITNTNYWFCTGIYNVQLENYRQEVQNYINEMLELEQIITDTNGNIVDIVADITQLQNDNTTNKTNITNNTTEITNIKNNITSLQQNDTTTAQAISTINQNLGTISTDITGIETSITGIDNDLTGVHSDITSINNALTSVNKNRNVSTVIKKMINGDTVNIVCYGDSMTYGYNGTTQTANPYPYKLQSLLRTHYKNNNINVYNEGTSGIQSDELVQDSYIANVTRHNPDLTILMCGINDNNSSSFGGAVVPLENYKTNLISIIGKIDSSFILMSPTPYMKSGTDGEEIVKNRIMEYVKAVKELSLQYNTDYIDTFKAVDNELRYNARYWNDIYIDDLHFTDAYYQKFGEIVFSFGLCDDNIIIDEDTNINAYSSCWNIDGEVASFIGANNPQYKNLMIKPSCEANIEIFINKPQAKIYLYCPVGTSIPLASNSCRVLLDEVVLTSLPLTSLFTVNNAVFWDEKFFIKELSYGYHKIRVQNTGTSGNLYVSSLKAEITKKIDNAYNFSSGYSTNGGLVVYDSPRTLTTGGVTAKYYNYIGSYGDITQGKKYKITVNPSGTMQGFGIGKHKVRINGNVFQFPKYFFYNDDSGNFKVSILSMGGVADIPTETLTTLTKTGTVPMVVGQDNDIQFEFTSTGVNVLVNNSLSMTFTYDEFLFANLDVWLFGFSPNKSTTIKQIQELF